MAKKKTKQENGLGLVALESPPPSSVEIIPFGLPDRLLTREQKRVVEEYDRQVLIIEAIAAKTVFAQDEIITIHQNGASDFLTTIEYLFELKEAARGTEHQVYMEEWTKLQARTLVKHLMGAMEVGATNIGAMIHAPLDLPPEKRSLWKWLFG